MRVHDICPGHDELLGAHVDGELDAADAAACEAHVRSCPACAAHLEDLVALRARLAVPGVRQPASPAFRQRVAAALRHEAHGSAPSRRRDGFAGLVAGLARFALGLPAAAAVIAGMLVLAPLRAPPGLVDDLVAAHVRSLQVDHLTDVPTSDRHTVKPWFAGKVAFSPPVVDLADRGFPLVGGRVDYVDHRAVAAIVYRRHGHVINLFVWPADAPATGDAAFREEGYNVVRWEQGGLVHYAVGDVDPAELDTFRAAAAARTPD